MKERSVIRVVCAVIQQGNTYFLARRSEGKSQAGYWEFPGGKLEEGESESECLKRELWEELEMTINVSTHIGASVFRYSDKEIELSAWLCASPGTYMLHEHDMAGWFTADEIKRLTLAPADVFILDYLA